jgi:hypothetical protein
MKIGDVVRERCSGEIGLIIERYKRTEACGPDGDFMVYYRYLALFDSGKRTISDRSSVEVVS